MAEERSDVTAEDLVEQVDKMTIPANGKSVSDSITSMIDYLRKLPHIRDLKEPLQALIDLQKFPWTAKEDSGLQSLQDVLQNEFRLAAKWKRLRLLFEPSTFAETLRNTFRDIRDSFNTLQIPSKGNIVEKLDKVILDLSDGGNLSLQLNKAESDFRNQFLEFLRGYLSKSATSEAISVCTWLAKQPGTDVESIRQELKEIKDNRGTFLEELILCITEVERKCTEESSDANLKGDGFDESLDVVALNGVQDLKKNVVANMARVIEGFDQLIKCTKLRGGKLEVYKANAIEDAIRIAVAEEGRYIGRKAVKFLEALTSRDGDLQYSDRGKICIAVSDHVEVLLKLMKAKKHFEARLLAAETVVNILVKKSVWRTVRTQHEIVSALVAISKDAAYQSNNERDRADHVCLSGLKRLTKFSKEVNLKMNATGDKTQTIVTDLMKLLCEGLKDDSVANLAKDSLVALDTQVLVVEHGTPTHEVCSIVREHMSNLIKTEGFVLHSSVSGRMAIISILTKLCKWYKEDITDGLFLYLLKMIKRTGDEILNPMGSEKEQVNDLTKLLRDSVTLLCFCVTHGKDTAQSVLAKNAEERTTLEKMLDEEDSGILDESRLEILYILDEIDKGSSQGPTVVGGVAHLLKMAKSSSPACRQQVASRLLKWVKEQPDVTEMEMSGVIDALMGLLKEQNENCQRDALLALYALSSFPNITIQTDQLPHQTVLDFLSPKYELDVRDAAVGLLDLMVERNAVDAKKFMEIPGALKNTLSWLDTSPESSSSQNSASALLKMATEDGNSVRLGIANVGLGTLVKYVQNGQNDNFEQLLTTTLSMICKTEEGSNQDAVIKEGGHTFLLQSLQKDALKRTAAEGLWSLIDNTRTCGDVLRAGFVAIAVGSIDLKFANTDIARGLATICSTAEGLDQIYASSRSVQALLILLEHCPQLVGKGSAAAVITRLYPRLNRNGDSLRQNEMTEACRHLIKYLEMDDKSQLEIFLEALAAFATGKRGRRLIHEERGEEPLIKYLKHKEIESRVQDLVLKILAEMSCVITEGGEKKDSNYYKILNVFMENRIAELLCPLPDSDVFNQKTESMKNLLILIRNLSLAGQSAVSQLSEQGAVFMLLKVLKNHETSLSLVTELAVKALEKFMDDPIGKQVFLKGGGIQYLVAVLKRARGSDVKSFTTIILTSVAKDPDTRRTACELIFSCDILLALNAIMYDGETSRIKWQAAVLMKLLAMYGPTSKVCAAIKNKGCLDALDNLRSVQHCQEMANDVLRFVREKNRDCRKTIDTMLSANSR